MAFSKSISEDNCCLRKLFSLEKKLFESEIIFKKFTIRSSFAFVMPVLDDILNELRYTGYCSDEKIVDIFLVLSELIINAIEHGNRQDLTKNVTIEYILNENKACFSIEDEGEGYDYKNTLTNEKVKGLCFIKYIASNVCWNSKGNKTFVCMPFS